MLLACMKVEKNVLMHLRHKQNTVNIFVHCLITQKLIVQINAIFFLHFGSTIVHLRCQRKVRQYYFE